MQRFQNRDVYKCTLYGIAGIKEPLLRLALKLSLNARSFLVSLSLSRIATANTGVAVHTTHFTRQDACQCKIYIKRIHC